MFIVLMTFACIAYMRNKGNAFYIAKDIYIKSANVQNIRVIMSLSSCVQLSNWLETTSCECNLVKNY